MFDHLDAEAFPGPDALTDPLDTACSAAYETQPERGVGIVGETIGYYVPSEESWSTGDRRVVCVAITVGE